MSTEFDTLEALARSAAKRAEETPVWSANRAAHAEHAQTLIDAAIKAGKAELNRRTAERKAASDALCALQDCIETLKANGPKMHAWMYLDRADEALEDMAPSEARIRLSRSLEDVRAAVNRFAGRELH